MSTELLNTKDGPITSRVSVEIKEDGSLCLEGQDMGPVVEQFFGDSDYEYWLYIEAKDKDRVLLALIEKMYGGTPKPLEDFQRFLKSKKIPAKFSSY